MDLLNFTCCHTEIEVADQTFNLTQSQYTDTGPTSPSTDPILLGKWQGSHWSANVQVTGMTRPGKILSQAGSSAPEADALTTRPARQYTCTYNTYRGNRDSNKVHFSSHFKTFLLSHDMLGVSNMHVIICIIYKITLLRISTYWHK